MDAKAIAQRAKAGRATPADWEALAKDCDDGGDGYEVMRRHLDELEENGARDLLSTNVEILRKLQELLEANRAAQKLLEASQAAAPQLERAVAQHAKEVARLIELLAKPRVRTGVVELPDGPITMRITETRQ